MFTNLEINKKYIIIYDYKQNNEKLTQLLTVKYIKTETDAGHAYAYFTNVKDFFYKTIYDDIKFSVSSVYSCVFYERIFDSSIQLKMEEKSLKLILKNLIDPTFKHYLFDNFKEISLAIEELDISSNTVSELKTLDIEELDTEIEEIDQNIFNEMLESHIELDTDLIQELNINSFI